MLYPSKGTKVNEMKTLTEKQTKFKGVEHYRNLKRRFNQNDVNNSYNKTYKLPEYIGYCMRIFERLAPESYEDAFEKYTNSGYDTDFDSLNRGRTKEELIAIAKKWMEECPDSMLSLEDFYDGLILHIVVETYDGYVREKQVKDALKQAGATIETVTGDEDSRMAIDIKAELNGNTFLVQVKPVSFFIGGMSNKALNDDRKALSKKERRAREKYGTNTYFRYLLYDSFNTGEWIVNTSCNKCSFSYDELLDDFGRPKKSYETLKKNTSKILFNNNK